MWAVFAFPKESLEDHQNLLDEVNPENWAKWLQTQGLNIQLTIFFFLFPSVVVLADTQGNIKHKKNKEEDVAGEKGHPSKILDKVDIRPIHKNIFFFFEISKNARLFMLHFDK